MVRSLRRGTVLAALACGGLSLVWTGLVPGQQPKTTETASTSVTQTKSTAAPAKPSATASMPQERLLTVHENGRSMRCQVISTWRVEDGSLAYQAQVIDTGEMLTIVEDGPTTTLEGRKGKLRALSTKIFHWARSNTPPPGSPLPPGMVAGVPAGQMAGQTAGQTVVSSSGPAPAPVVIAEGPPMLVEVTSGSPPVCVECSTTCVEARPQRRLGERLFGSLPRNTGRDWHAQWGEGIFAKNQQPGQSTVEQAPLLPHVASKPGASTEKTETARSFLELPISPEEKKEDVLLNPGRAALTDDKVRAPKSRYSDAGLPNDSRMPLGAQSVLAANNGLVNQVTYVPVPIVTVPQPYRPPVPPPPNMPKAPEPTGYANAFSSPPEPKMQPPVPPIQPGLPMGRRPEFLPPAPPPGQAMMPMPYPPFAYGPPPMMPPGMMPPGMMPPGMMPPGMMPPRATGAMGPFGPYPVAQVNHPNMYRGPLPPNPVAFQPPPPMPMMPMPMPYPQPPAPMPPAPQPTHQPGVASVGDQTIIEQVVILRDSLYPAQREMAADALAAADWRRQPEIVDMLLIAARQDPAASVRAACCRCLVRLNLNSEPVLGTLTALKADADPRVRAEAEQALTRLAGSPPPAGAIQPTRGQ